MPTQTWEEIGLVGEGSCGGGHGRRVPVGVRVNDFEPRRVVGDLDRLIVVVDALMDEAAHVTRVRADLRVGAADVAEQVRGVLLDADAGGQQRPPVESERRARSCARMLLQKPSDFRTPVKQCLTCLAGRQSGSVKQSVWHSVWFN